MGSCAQSSQQVPTPRTTWAATPARSGRTGRQSSPEDRKAKGQEIQRVASPPSASTSTPAPQLRASASPGDTGFSGHLPGLVDGLSAGAAHQTMGGLSTHQHLVNGLVSFLSRRSCQRPVHRRVRRWASSCLDTPVHPKATATMASSPQWAAPRPATPDLAATPHILATAKAKGRLPHPLPHPAPVCGTDRIHQHGQCSLSFSEHVYP